MNFITLVLGEMYRTVKSPLWSEHTVSNWLYPHIAVLEHLNLMFDVLT